MRIKEVHFPYNSKFNLRPIEMTGLGDIVVLAGRNGVGKTRLFHQLNDWASSFVKENDLINNIARKNDRLHSLVKNKRETLQRSLEILNEQMNYRKQVVLTEDVKPNFVPFVPKKLTLKDPQGLTPSSLLGAAKNTETPGVANLDNSTFPLIQSLQNRYREATHQERLVSHTDADNAIAEYKRLEEIVKQLLSTNITRSVDGVAQIFGLDLGKSALSDGQKVILQLCAAIHAQGAGLNDLIIVMDEPENHLHPAALLDLLNIIKEKIGNGQIWIATHSIALLANVDPSAIWWMDDNGISKAGSMPEKVLEGLLGDEERRDKLAAFLDLPFEHASNRFVAECFQEPTTVPYNDGDPQTKQMRTAIESRFQEVKPLRVLDFGAGQGRLALEFHEAWQQQAAEKIDYIAFDSSQENREQCIASIKTLYNVYDNRIFHDASDLRAKYDEKSFDIIIMCNVLHEIPCTKWGRLLGKGKMFDNLLKPDGFLMIVEVQQLPYGEHANSNGFLVMDTCQIKKLFSIREGNEQQGLFFVDSQSQGWLKAHLIGSALVERYTPETLKAALEDLSLMAKDSIRQLRQSGNNYRDGRKHGFWVQQFANAELALDR